MRQDAQKRSRKFCRSKEGKNSETHPEKPEKGETGCVLGAGEGSSGWRRMRPGEKPGVRTKVNTITMQHVQKENRQKPKVSAGFVAGAEGLEPSARGFGVDVGGCTRERGKDRCCAVPTASLGEGGASVVLRGIFNPINSG